MIFLHLFYTFLLIGAFTFGGGYSMIALIQSEVVVNHQWMTASEFTDLLAVSQMTPGPVGINTATYAGYTAVLNAGYPAWAAVIGSLIASLAVIIIPVALMMLVGRWLLRHKDQPHIAAALSTLRLAVIGLIAAAALQLFCEVFSVQCSVFSNPGAAAELNTEHLTLNTEHLTLNTEHLTLNTEHLTLNTEHLTLNTEHLTLNTIIFLSVFLLSWRKKTSPILLIIASGLVGLVVFTLCTKI